MLLAREWKKEWNQSYKGMFSDGELITFQEFYDVFIQTDIECKDKFYMLGLQDIKDRGANRIDIINVMLFFDKGNHK